jgi:transcriptional/translational regulatory protein YebC/TACO1
VAEIRHLFGRHGGNLGESGSVAWMFEKRGLIKVAKKNYDEDALFMIALEAGAEDIKSDDEDFYHIFTSYDQLEKIQDALAKNNITVDSAERTLLPKTTMHLDGKQAEQMLRLMEALDDHDDIQGVFANFDIDDEVMASIA